MAETTNEKKTYERPTLEKKQKLAEIAEGVEITVTPGGPR